MRPHDTTIIKVQGLVGRFAVDRPRVFASYASLAPTEPPHWANSFQAALTCCSIPNESSGRPGGQFRPLSLALESKPFDVSTTHFFLEFPATLWSLTPGLPGQNWPNLLRLIIAICVDDLLLSDQHFSIIGPAMASIIGDSDNAQNAESPADTANGQVASPEPTHGLPPLRIEYFINKRRGRVAGLQPECYNLIWALRGSSSKDDDHVDGTCFSSSCPASRKA
jgi:hypothetical protein